MSSVIEQQDDDIGTPTDEVIASFIWCDGHICVAYYNTSSLDLYITYETVDLRPDFCHLQNLFRIMPNMRNVLASGPEVFLKAVMKLCDVPDVDPIRYRLYNLRSISAATFVVYVNNEKTLIENRKRILEMHMPRMVPKMTDQERFNFIESVIPMHQALVVQCLGNLLHFLDANWKYLFLREETRPVVSDVQLYKLDGCVLIDESTFGTLQAFAHKDHPSAFKRGYGYAQVSDNGPSMYSLMNTCVCRMGSNQLKAWLYQPINGIEELERRHRMIEWCRNEKNATNMTKFRAALKQILNAGELYGSLLRTRGKPNVWKLFKRTLYYTNEIAELCMMLVKAKAPDIVDTVVEDFGKYSLEHTNVYDMLKNIDSVIDLDTSMSTGMFSIREGMDPVLDGKKDQFYAAKEELIAKIREEFKHLPHTINTLTCHYISELGFLIAIPTNSDAFHDVQNSGRFQVAYQLRETSYFTSPLCAETSEKVGHVYVDIREREQEICDRLIEYVYMDLYDIHLAISFCGRLDCLMAMASFSQKYDLVCPELVNGQKVLEIKAGRHLLVELRRKCVECDTSVSVGKKNLINILIAPNASGKSVYMKEIAQITYLAHIGSYVPAQQATISTVDAIFTRMYSPESIYLSKSSYLVELQQMSNVIMNSSSKSLILVDEMGQGTTETDGKALLISCLRHLAKRGDKSPISFITTHYTDVYDYMVNTEWVAMKTFEMVEATSGGLISTFKVIDGKCVARYAKDCALLRRFTEPAVESHATPDIDSAGPSHASGRTSFSDDKTDIDEESLEEIEDAIREKKIKCAAAVVQAFLRNKANPREKINYMDIIKNFRI